MTNSSPSPEEDVNSSQGEVTQGTGRKGRRRRVIRPGKEQGGVTAEAWSDTDAAWGDKPQEPDEFYLRDKPPHWGP